MANSDVVFSRRCLTLAAFASAMFGVSVAAAVETVSAMKAPADQCGAVQARSVSFTVCRYPLAEIELRTLLSDPDGRPLGSLSAAKRMLASQSRQTLLLTNGGMYHDDLSPVGYYVEHGRKLKNANTRRGPGNFHLMPNGIFYIERAGAGVMETRAFLKRNRRPQFATQSGPMLVINGQIHPQFDPNSKSRKTRNGVGVSGDGKTVFFAITDAPATFFEFADLFHSRLKTPNALFLDGGSVPQMWARAGVDRLNFAPVGPVIAVMAQRQAAERTTER